MATKPNGADNPFEAFSSQNGATSNTLRLFSDELIQRFKGKFLELYIGDQAESVNWDDYSVPYNSSIFGKLIDVLDRFIILECLYVRDGELQTGNLIYINTFQIRAMSEINHEGSLKDIFLHIKDADQVRSLLHKMHDKK